MEVTMRKTVFLCALPYLSDQFRLKSGVLFFIGQPGINAPNRTLYRADVFAR